MAFQVPSLEPEVLYAGATWQWTKTPPSFPASEGWTLSYKFVSSIGTIAFDATTGTNNYAVLVTAALTAQYIPGRYQWTAYVTKSGEVHIADTGYLDVQPDPVTSKAADTRTHARKVLELLYAVKEAHVTGGSIISYSVAGRSVTRGTIAELNRDIVAYEARVRAEEHPGSFGRPVEFHNRAPR